VRSGNRATELEGLMVTSQPGSNYCRQETRKKKADTSV